MKSKSERALELHSLEKELIERMEEEIKRAIEGCTLSNEEIRTALIDIIHNRLGVE